jgi:hypothetical protein
LPRDTPAAAAADNAKAQAKPPFRFVYVSGAGSTFTPGLFTSLFGRVKGETELALAAMVDRDPAAWQAVTVRPAAPDFAAHDAIKPYVPAQGAVRHVADAVLLPIIRTAAKSLWAPTAPLGTFLTEMAMGKWDAGRLAGPGVEKVGENGFFVVENGAFRRAMGLDGKAT